MECTSKFKPHQCIKNPHMQTMFATIFKSYLPLLPQYHIEHVELDDGDYIELIWPFHELNPNAPLVLLLHGLGGGVQSSYVTILFNTLIENGFRPVLMHFRGGGLKTNRLPRMYNAGDTNDLNFVVDLLNRKEPETPKAIVGISLGGNVLLKWLGEKGKAANIGKAIAISVPYDLEGLVSHLDSQMLNIYRNHLLIKLKNLYLRKSESDLIVKPDEIKSIKTIRDFDNRLTAPLAGFKNAHDYYQQSACLPFLKNISIDTLLIHAVDDPFMTPRCIPNLLDLSPGVHLELSHHGGHVGFISKRALFKPDFWLAKRVPEFLMEMHA